MEQGNSESIFKLNKKQNSMYRNINLRFFFSSDDEGFGLPIFSGGDIQFKNASDFILLSFKVPPERFSSQGFLNRSYFFEYVVIRIAKLSLKLYHIGGIWLLILSHCL